MTQEMDEEAEASVPVSVGMQLRAAREQRGLSLEQVGADTRIPQRHLVTIEEGRFADLPARTYAVGFSKSYAKMVGLDEDDVADLVRDELDAQQDDGHRGHSGFEPGDPARVPSGRLVWFSVAALVLLLVGGFFFMRVLFAPAAELPSLVEQEEAERAAELASRSEAALEGTSGGARSAPGGPVVFTALEDGVWVKFYDASGRQLMQKLMAKGERYTVPADADGPQVWTGRPDAFAITIGGRSVPKLAEEDQVMRDIPVTAVALRARAAEGSGASPTN